jgi:hypothetical protein
MTEHLCCPSHCCSKHGCKYGYEDCPVVLGLDPGITCESCDYDDFERQNLQKQYALNIINTRIKALQLALRK